MVAGDFNADLADPEENKHAEDITTALFAVQAVILYVLDTWVMYPHTGRKLKGFHHRLVWRLTGRMPQSNLYGTWTYPSLEEAMLKAGVQEVETNVARCQNKASQFIAKKTIMDLYLEVERLPGARVSKRWWEHLGLDIEGIQQAAW